MGLLSKGLRLSASWDPLGGSPDPPQVRTSDGGFGRKPPSGSHDAERRSLSHSNPKFQLLNSTMRVVYKRSDPPYSSQPGANMNRMGVSTGLCNFEVSTGFRSVRVE